MKNSDDYSDVSFSSHPEDNMRMKALLLLGKMKGSRKMMFRGGMILLVLVLFVGGIFFYYSRMDNAKQVAFDEQQKQAAIEKAKTTENAFVSDVSTALNKEEKTVFIPKSIPKSENFQMREVVFGGYETTMGGEIKDAPLKIYDVRSEALTSKDGKQAKLYISWRTNKLAVSQVIYSKPGKAPDILLEDGVGFSHALIIGKFDFDTRYSYVVKAKDRWGNSVESDQFSAYSGKKADSIIEMIANEFKDIFSWTKPTK